MNEAVMVQQSNKIDITKVQESDLAKMSTSDLRDFFAGIDQQIANGIYLKACAYVQLLARGEAPKSDSRWATYYPMIASGQLSPEFAQKVFSQEIVRRIAGLPLERQRQLVDPNTKVQLVEGPDKAVKEVPFAYLVAKPQLLGRVFAAGREIPPEEQKATIRERKAAKGAAKEKKKAPVINVLRNELGQGPHKPIPRDEIESQNAEWVGFWVRHKHADHLRKNAAAVGLTVPELVDKLLHEAGWYILKEEAKS